MKRPRAGAVTVVAILVLWTVAAETGLISTRFLPSPLRIAQEFWAVLRDGYVGVPLYKHFGSSLLRTLSGFLAAVVVGIPLGLLIGWNELAASMFAPILAFIRPIPPIGLIPLFILWFGIGEVSKVSLIFYASLLFVTLNAAAGVREIPITLIRAASTLGVNKAKLFFYVILPASLPQVITGVKAGAVVSWSVLVASELIAAQYGMGFMIMDAATFFRIEDVFVGILIIGVVGLLLESTISYLRDRYVHWSGR